MMNGLLLALGLVILIKGAGFLVEGAVGLAWVWVINDALIGLTIVAVGTSSRNNTVGRSHGILFVGLYVVYLVYVVARG